MANLPEANEYPAGIYQIETTDPVLGGPPNESTKAGVTNIPAMQLAKRTNWLKARVDQLVGKVIAASTLVAGIVQLSNATGSNSETMAATPLAVKAVNDSAVKVEGNQTIEGIKTFRRLRAAPAQGQLEPSLEIMGQGGEINGLYAVPAANSTGPDGGVRLSLKSLARMEFGYDNVLRPTTFGEGAMQIHPDMLSGLAMPALRSSVAGWQRLPSGLLMQWGYSSSNAISQTILFPVAFLNAVRVVNVTGAWGTDSSRTSAFNVRTVGLTSFNVYQSVVAGGNTQFSWFAVGF